jgi:LacI family transcriptional regulator
MSSIKDVAEKAKVSIGTVDRVVHNRGRVSKKTQEKVKKVIEELKYKPNLYARNLSLSRSYSFAVLMPHPEQDSGYWENAVKGVQNAVSMLKPYHVKAKCYHFDRYSEESFQEACQRIIQADHDGILLAPVMGKSIREFVRDIPKNTPYVLFNANVPDINAVSFIGQDSYQSGAVCGRLMSMMLKDPLSSAVILAVYDDFHIMERADGFKHYFDSEDSSRTIRMYSMHRNSGKESFFDLIDQIIRENEGIGGIFVTNASTHFVAEYLKEKMPERTIRLIGYDLVEKNVQYLKDGLIDVLISQKSEAQGYQGIYALYREVVLQQPCERNILMPIDIVIKENLVYYS